MLVLFDSDLHYRIVGPETLPFSQQKAAEMVGKHVDDIFPDETVAVLEPNLRATIAGGTRSFDIEYQDRIHHIETRSVRVGNEPYGILVTQDVTEVRQTAAALVTKNERLDQFASMVSHDLQNPLAIAVGELEQYRETGEDIHLDGIEDALVRVEDLIVDLTALAQTNSSSETRKSVSLPAVAREAWEYIDIRSASLETEDCTIQGDRSQLQALFENLFRNAVGHGGADVTVRVGPIGSGFYVEDTGKGIPQAKREQVFEHGFTTGYSGNGVGLTIVNRIATDHEFEATLMESQEGGARFEFQ
ncbi:two-component sensor histidine kinase [Natronolimnobius baerhuensis]|uniref:histidine kinase n=1 Tax=Natronolimnobius baerhuensis TaxID=253108 RepID=A0A202E787_9EURY|nr:two-component sensor histidine kinase [Natronolimnobius baerhuensis]